ncbi:hypothetical protein [Arenicella xantha]|uniref:Uncharacterized protein n=1 Tax=Arenicella xantha TaxID=644221 RepID=A0A395JJU0_9GAMM|nr:hypothetical protein [Arenicella xantha]RBP49162.1 hypothetical protein DFR28_10488 [Arenicella xantha]
MADSPIATNRLVKSASLIIGLCACSWLAFSAFAAYTSFASTDVGLVNSYMNPYVVNTPDVVDQARMLELDQQLGFMVWASERRELAAEQSNVLRKMLNEQPFRYALWRRLSFAELDAGSANEEYAFAVKRALILGKWNLKERLALLHHCVVNFAALENVLPNMCRNELLNIPTETHRGTVLGAAGVSLDQLNAAFTMAGVTNPYTQ